MDGLGGEHHVAANLAFESLMTFFTFTTRVRVERSPCTRLDLCLQGGEKKNISVTQDEMKIIHLIVFDLCEFGGGFVPQVDGVVEEAVDEAWEHLLVETLAFDRLAVSRQLPKELDDSCNRITNVELEGRREELIMW